MPIRRRPGGPSSQIQELYREKGYDLASVTLLEGGNQGDTKIVIEIFEGPKAKVTSINFKGNQFRFVGNIENSYQHSKSILGLFGRYDAEMLEDDRQKLIDYYYRQRLFRGESGAGDPVEGKSGRDRAHVRDLGGNAVHGFAT